MRLRISLCLLLAAALWFALSADAAIVGTYPVGDIGLDVVPSGGIVVDKGGNLWFAARFLPDTASTRPALCRLDMYKNRVLSFRLPTVIDEVGALAYDAPRNIIWLADSAGHTLCKFNIIKRILTVYYVPAQVGDMPDIQSIAVDGFGKVFCALNISGAIGVFDPTTPDVMTIYGTPTPYSVAVDAVGETAYFTSGNNPGGWLFGWLDLTVPAWVERGTAGADINTRCLQLDEANDLVFMTATGANAVGVFDPGANTLTSYGVCTAGSGVYGIDLENGDEVAWVSESLNKAVAWIDTTTATGADVPITISSTALVTPETEDVSRPWVYQIAPKWCPITPSVKIVDDSCPIIAVGLEEFILSTTSMPGAVVVKGYDSLYATFVADTFDDTIVVVVRF